MNSRQNSLLKLLVKSNHFQLIREYCNILHCSEKTVRNDIKILNSFLAEHRFKAKILSRQGHGIKMVLSSDEKEYLYYLLDTELLETLPNLERFYHGIIALLLSDEFYTIDSLAEVLYSNSVQIKEDLLRWSNMLLTFHLKFVKKPHLMLQGQEENIRSFVMYYFYLLAVKAMTKKIEPFIMGEDRTLFKAVLSIMEKDQGLNFTSNALHQLEFYIALMIRRIQLGHIIHIHIPETYNSDAYVEIKHMLEQHFMVKIPVSELSFLEKMAEGAAKKWTDRLFFNYRISKRSEEMTDAFVYALEARYLKPVSQDLKSALNILMETSLRRKRNGLLVLNNEGNMIKTVYLKEYLLVTRVFFDTPHLNDCYFNDMEFTRFTMLLLPYFNEIALAHKYNAGLIVNCSLELAYFSKYKIELYVPQISVTRILTEEEIPGTNAEIDFFITFNYIESGTPRVEISSMVCQKDIEKIYAFLDSFRMDRLKHTKIHMKQYVKSLETSVLPDIINTLYQDMSFHGTSDLNCIEFAKRVATQKVLLSETMLVILFDASVKRQMLLTYEAKSKTYIDGRLIKYIKVVYITDTDEIHLEQLIEKLRQDLNIVVSG